MANGRRPRVPPALEPPRSTRGQAWTAHLHVHCVVIDGVFDAAAAGGVIFHAATGLDATAIAEVQAQVRIAATFAKTRTGLSLGTVVIPVTTA